MNHNRNYSPMGIFTKCQQAAQALKDILEFRTGQAWHKSPTFGTLLRGLTGDPIGTYRHQRIFAKQLLPDLLYNAIMGCEQSLAKAKRLMKLDEDYHYATTINYKNGEAVYTSVPRCELLRLNA